VGSKTFLMLLFCGAIFASISYFVVTGRSPKEAWKWAENGFHEPRVRMEPELPAPAGAVAKKAPSAPKRQAVALQAPTEPLAEALPQAPPPPSKPQPGSSDQIVGITKAELLERFATPSLQLNSLHDGDAIESIYYNHKGSSRPSVVELRNGIVTNAQFGANPGLAAK